MCIYTADTERIDVAARFMVLADRLDTWSRRLVWGHALDRDRMAQKIQPMWDSYSLSHDNFETVFVFTLGSSELVMTMSFFGISIFS